MEIKQRAVGGEGRSLVNINTRGWAEALGLEFEEKLSVIELVCSSGTDRRPCGSRCSIRLD